jgi:hypothetical protein
MGLLRDCWEFVTSPNPFATNDADEIKAGVSFCALGDVNAYGCQTGSRKIHSDGQVGAQAGLPEKNRELERLKNTFPGDRRPTQATAKAIRWI